MTALPALRAVTCALIAAALMAACSGGQRRLPGDDEPTLLHLSQRKIELEPDPGIETTEADTIEAYQRFLAAAPQAPQRPEAMRRLGDLEMDLADRQAGEAATAPVASASSALPPDPDYKVAIERYQHYLKTFPDAPRNDRVLYQLARAQDQSGQLEAALQTLTRLVIEHPGTLHVDEAQFRRGELLFSMRDYTKAESAFASVLTSGHTTPFSDRALYMQGWSLYKLGRLEESLKSFFGVLDAKLAGLTPTERDESDLAQIAPLTRGDRELLDDTFRVISISLSNLHGAETIPPLIDSPLREQYQFRVFQQLGELYIRQDRIKDAADAFALFVNRQPLHPQAPLLQARVIDIYEKNGFDTLALQAKRDHVTRYGAASEFRKASPTGWALAQPLVKRHLTELARHHHALAQKQKSADDVQLAVRWYREFLDGFADDVQAPQMRFLLAELLFDDRRFADAAVEYERVAYDGVGDDGARAANAGYAALLAYAAQDGAGAGASTEQRLVLQRQGVASALRFADAFTADARRGSVLTRAADQLYALNDKSASDVARRALSAQPPPDGAERRTAWTVIAHQAFERNAYAEAEQAYAQVLALGNERTAGYATIAERHAATIYRQGEAARESGEARVAVGHFARIASLGALTATSALRASAQFDAAAALIGLKDWDAAAVALQDFRRQFPSHPLQAEVPAKLALVDLELGRWGAAADEFDRVAVQAQSSPPAGADPQQVLALARSARWQAAELRGKATKDAAPRSAQLGAAIRSYETYLQQFPQPLETAVEARWQLARLSRQDGQAARAQTWLQEVRDSDRNAGEARTPRTRLLGGQAALTLTEALLETYRKVALIEPLAKQLKLKKARLQEVLQAYGAASETGAAEVVTAATFQTAALYQDFGRALMASQRPKKLNKAELEQYNVMLEEQAFPFEEQAIQLHESNARRAAGGVYDEHVRKSFAELAAMKPARWGKVERGDPVLPMDAAKLEAALRETPGKAALLNQLGIAQRRDGRFEQARQSYEAAIAVDPLSSASHLNLAILFDLYLGDAAKALPLYQRGLELSPADAATVGKWVAELKSRKPPPNATATVASKEGA